MKQETVNQILRTLLTGFGGYLVGINVLGVTIDAVLWQSILGILMALTGIIWSIRSKTLGIEQVAGVVRQIITVFGGVLVASGKLKNDILEMLLALIPLVFPLAQAKISSKTNTQIKSGEINLLDLKK